MPVFERPPLDTLAPAKDRRTTIYPEHGRIEVDDSSIKWIGSDGLITRLPIATLSALILDPDTTVTHAAVKAAAQSTARSSGWERTACASSPPRVGMGRICCFPSKSLLRFPHPRGDGPRGVLATEGHRYGYPLSFARLFGRKMPSLRMSSPSKWISPPPQSLRWMFTMSQWIWDWLPLSAIS